MAWTKGGTTTLTGGSDTITVSDMTATIFNFVITHQNITDYGVGGQLVFANDTASNYAHNMCLNGGSNSTGTNQAHIDFASDNTTDSQFGIAYVVNIDSKEKLVLGYITSMGGSGAGNDPDRREQAAKYTGSSQFIRVDITNINPGMGDFLADSNLTVLGTD